MENLPLPVGVSELTASHSGLTAVLAGFALAGLFLLMERRQDSDSLQELHNRSMMFLFLAFIIGSLSSFLYSSMSGFNFAPEFSYYIFQFPSALFAVTAGILLSGISLMFSTLRMGSVEKPSHVITLLVVIFAIFTIWQDVSYASDYYKLHSLRHIALSVIAVLPVVVALTTMIIPRFTSRFRFHEWIQRRTFEPFAYTTIAWCLLLAYLNATMNYQVNPTVGPKLYTQILSLGAVSVINCWAILMIPWQQQTQVLAD